MNSMQEFTSPQGIYYRTNAWQAGRPTLVFMHGLSGSSSAWLPHEKVFVDTHNILSFDLRGHGKSLKYKAYDAYRIANFADDLYALIEFLGIKKFILVTHSFGCLIALEFLAKHQDRVSAAVLLSPSYSVFTNPLAKIGRPLLALSRLFSLLPFRPRPGYHVDYTSLHNARDWDIKMTYGDVRCTTLRIYLYCSRQALFVDYTNLLEHITIPTLLVQGEHDSIFPLENSRVMAEKIPHAQRVVLNDADHIIVVNHTPRILKIITPFIKEHSV